MGRHSAIMQLRLLHGSPDESFGVEGVLRPLEEGHGLRIIVTGEDQVGALGHDLQLGSRQELDLRVRFKDGGTYTHTDRHIVGSLDAFFRFYSPPQGLSPCSG